MKKNISFIAALILMMASSALFAQDKATELFGKIAQSISNHKNVEVSFTFQTIENDGQVDELQEGKAYFEGEAYKILMGELHTISDGVTEWLYLPEDQEVMISNVSKDDGSPVRIFTELKNEANVQVKDTDVQGNVRLELFDSKGNPIGLTLTFDKNDNLKKLQIVLDENGSLHMNINEIKYDQTFQEGFFRFDKKDYPRVDVIDMR